MKKLFATFLAILMLIPSTITAFAMETSYEITVNGKDTRATALTVDGVIMVPISTISRELGYKVTWNSSERSYHLENDAQACNVYMDSSIYTTYSTGSMGTTSPTDLGTAPKLIRSTVHVPVEMYRMLLGNSDNAVTIDGNTIHINGQGNYQKKTYSVTVNGKALKEKGQMEDGVIMVPLRSVSEKLGATLSWSRKNQAYHLEYNKSATDIYMDSSVYTVYSVNRSGTTSPSDLGAAPKDLNGITYVPVELFRILIDNKDKTVVIGENTISITGHLDDATIDNYSITVNNKKISQKGQMVDGVVMVPLQKVAKALDYRVYWSKREQTYQIKQSGQKICTVDMDSSIYTVYGGSGLGLTSPSDLGINPQIIDRRVYVPVELFRIILGNYDEAVIINGDHITIRTVSIGSAAPNS